MGALRSRTWLLALAAIAASCADLEAPFDEWDAPAADVGRSEAELYVKSSTVWPSPRIPVCWEPHAANAEWETLKRAARDQIQKTWERESAVVFVGWGTCVTSSRGVRVRIADERPYAHALGRYLDGRVGGIVLNFTFGTWATSCASRKDYCVRAYAVHEFGHVLGFVHEQNRPDTPSWCDDAQGSSGDQTIGPWDEDSVMNYCSRLWQNNGWLSAGDVVGVQTVYGRRASGSIAGMGAKCLDLPSAGDGVDVIAWECHGGANQKWRYDVATRSFRDGTAGRAIEVDDLATTNGAGLHQQAYVVGRTHQKWDLTDVHLKGLGSRALAAASTSGDDGTPIVLKRATSVSTQRWSIRSDRTIRGFGDKCLDRAASTSGAAVRLWTCNGSSNQRWSIAAGGEIRAYGTSMCLDAKGGSTAEGTEIILYGCHGGLNQKFKVAGRLLGAASARCIEDPSAGLTNGSKPRIWDCDGDDNQYWEFHP